MKSVLGFAVVGPAGTTMSASRASAFGAKDRKGRPPYATRLPAAATHWVSGSPNTASFAPGARMISGARPGARASTRRQSETGTMSAFTREA